MAHASCPTAATRLWAEQGTVRRRSYERGRGTRAALSQGARTRHRRTLDEGLQETLRREDLVVRDLGFPSYAPSAARGFLPCFHSALTADSSPSAGARK